MSKENLERFMTQVAESEELKARIGEEIDGDALIALGAEHGCEFTAEDLAAGAELRDEELAGVAGGITPVNPNKSGGPDNTGKEVLMTERDARGWEASNKGLASVAKSGSKNSDPHRM